MRGSLRYAPVAAAFRLAIHPLLCGILICLGVVVGGRFAAAGELRVQGTELQVLQPDGTTLAGRQLVGAQLTLGGPEAAPPVRIDAVTPDPQDPGGEILLYRFMVRDQGADGWRPLCPPGPDGLEVGFPLGGSWSARGDYRPSDRKVSLICANSAIGKCLRLGYRPWARLGGASLAPYHQACTRLLRADYCGDGVSHTRDGMAVRLHDRQGLQDSEGMVGGRFEAVWGPDGALCVRQPRLPGQSLDDIVAACPRLWGKVGKACRAELTTSDPKALIRSYHPGRR